MEELSNNKNDLFPEKKYSELEMKNKIKEIEDLKSKFESELAQKNKEIEDLKKQIKEYSNEIEDLKEQNDSMNIEDNDINEKNDSNKTIIILLLIVSIICIFILIYDKYKLNKRNEILNKIVMEYMIQKFPDFNQSVIMEKNENIMIFNEIQNKMNKPIKEIKKLYQATIDGGEPINFHNKCDNIPNTLVLIKSEGNRRFGGFTPIPWKIEHKRITDSKNETFVFSLDNKKMYYLENSDSAAVYHKKEIGPCFGGGHDIGIMGNPLKENQLYTNQYSYHYKGNSKSLSECDGQNNLKAIEYEVFQVLFY